MELITILNRCYHFRGFVYEHARFSADKRSIEVIVRPRKGSAAVCSRCHQRAAGYDQLAQRRFEFIPLWGFLVFLLYAMRPVDCRRCGVVAVEEVPWGDGKRPLTKAYMLFLARWARRLSWKPTISSDESTFVGLASKPLKHMLNIRVHGCLHGRFVARAADSRPIAIRFKRFDRSQRHAFLDLAQTLPGLLPGFHFRGKLLDVIALCRHVLPPILNAAVTSGYLFEIELRYGINGPRPLLGETISEKRERTQDHVACGHHALLRAENDYFAGGVPDPFMIQVYPVRPEKREIIPAVTHVDGSGRLQTVSRDSNPLYWRLIKAFEDLTGVPVLLNTSFNENEPIVRSPAQAIDCFMRTRMDALVLGSHTIIKKEAARMDSEVGELEGASHA